MRRSDSAKPRRVLVALWMEGVFGQETAEGIREWLEESRAEWNIRFTGSPQLAGTTLRWMLREGGIDGAITRFHDNEDLTALRRARVPSVWLDPDRVGACARRLSHTAFVGMDLRAVAAAAIDHFLSRAGFRSIGYVENYWDYGWSRDRGDALEAELARRGLRGLRFRHRGAASPEHAAEGPDFDGLSAWLRALEKPAAVVAANDATAAETLLLCETAGLAVPRDVAILGMDDNPVFCRNAEPNLSSVHFDARQAGRLCAATLAAMMDGAPPPRDPLLYGVAGVSQRASTGAVSAAGSLVQKALDHIDANACRGIGVADVARHCGVSRALLQLRFRELRGESVARAIRARRLAEARRLLAGTDLSSEGVAAVCGFGGVGALRRCVAAATGLSPGAWRERLRADGAR